MLANRPIWLQLLLGALVAYVLGVLLVAVGPSINSALGTVCMALGGVLKGLVATVLAIIGIAVLVVDLIRGVLK